MGYCFFGGAVLQSSHGEYLRFVYQFGVLGVVFGITVTPEPEMLLAA